jgi:alditol oxidase
MAETNWSGNYTYRATAVRRPRDVDELRRLVSGADSLQVLGTRHSFTSIGDATELIALDRLAGATEITLDRSAGTVSVGPTVTYADLAAVLNQAGLALANLASLPHISVVGAVTTASHGSGDREGNLATSVVGLQLATAAGEVIDFTHRDARFHGVVVNLGKLGVVTRVTLAVQPYYELRQYVYDGLEWDRLFEHFDEITAAGRSVSIFHRFGERTREVWVKRAGGNGDDPAGRVALFGAPAARGQRNPVPGADPANATDQLGEPGPWSERLPHFRSGFTPSSGEEIQSEFFVARPDAVAAIQALLGMAAEIQPLLFIAEVRTVAADSLWLSPQYGRDSVGLHFTWHRAQGEVERAVAQVERALSPFGARPHWGKLFTEPAGSIATRYPRMEDFRRLRAELDPRGLFTNEWAHERLIGSALGRRTSARLPKSS